MARITASKTQQPNKPAQENAVSQIREIVRRAADKPGALLAVLEETQRQDERRYLSEEALRTIASEMGESLARVYSVATFYSYYSLTPQGKNVIVVCRGTACHTRGSLGLLQEALSRLGAQSYREDEEASYTTDDAQFTVRTVACFGQCALAPVVAVNGTIYSRMSTARLCQVINALKKEAKK